MTLGMDATCVPSMSSGAQMQHATDNTQHATRQHATLPAQVSSGAKLEPSHLSSADELDDDLGDVRPRNRPCRVRLAVAIVFIHLPPCHHRHVARHAHTFARNHARKAGVA
jgi:hypothetical protein